MLAFLRTVARRDQDVNIIITETVRSFDTRIRNIDHLSLNPARAIRRPAVAIVARLKHGIERELRIKVGGLRKRSSVFQPVNTSLIACQSDSRTRTISRQNEPGGEKNSDYNSDD